MKKIIIVGLTMVLFLGAGGYAFAGRLDSPGAPATKGRMHTITDIHKYLTDVDAVLPGPVTGTADSGTATTLVSAALGSYSTGYFTGWQIEITGGAGIGQFRTVSDFTTTTGTVTVATWNINPDSTSTYELSRQPSLDNVFSNLQRLPATGQATCYNASGTLISCAGTGQDGEYQKGATKRYNKYAIGSDYVTVDLNTKLMWASAGNAAGCNNGATATWINALSYCEGLTFAGYTDWRLPNAYELFSIVLLDPTHGGPYINTTAFPNTVSGYYWSSTTGVHSTDGALLVYFDYGPVVYGNRANSYYVRCVRGGQ